MQLVRFVRWRGAGATRSGERCAHLYRPDGAGGAGLQGDPHREREDANNEHKHRARSEHQNAQAPKDIRRRAHSRAHGAHDHGAHILSRLDCLGGFAPTRREGTATEETIITPTTIPSEIVNEGRPQHDLV